MEVTRSELASLLQSIEGWLYLDEAWLLHKAASGLPANGVAVEIGSWKGRSTVAIASGLPGTATLVAVDPHHGSREHGHVDTFSEFMRNVGQSGFEDRVNPIRETSLRASGTVADRSVDLLFVDGSHEFDDVLTDIEAWEPKLKPTAFVAFNDVFWSDVARALAVRVLHRRSPYRLAGLVKNTLAFHFRPDAAWTISDDWTLALVRGLSAIRVRLRQVSPHMPRGAISLGHRLSERLIRRSD